MSESISSARSDYENLLVHWNEAFCLTQEDRDELKQEAAGADAWKELSPSPKLLDAAKSLKDCQNVLDYGSGSGWGGITLAKCGCRRVTCADPAQNAREMARCYAEQYGVADQIDAVCVSESWLAEVPDKTYDGLFCSNVLDVVPPEMAEDILRHAARIVTENARIVIGMNFYFQPDAVAKRGFDCKDGNRIYMGGVLRLVNRTDEEWSAILEKYFQIERLEHFAWPGEEAETRRLYFLRPKAGDKT